MSSAAAVLPDMNIALSNGNAEGAVPIDPFMARAVSQGIAVRFK